MESTAPCMKCPDVEEYPMCAFRCDRTEADIENIIRSRGHKTKEATMLKMIGWGVLALVALFALTWMAMGNEFFLYKFFAPKQEAVRRQVFEQSKAYNQGTIQELQNMQFEYIKADKEHKAALASIILHRSADYDANQMPADLRGFIQELKGGVK